MWINRIKWRDGKTNVRGTKTDEEIIKNSLHNSEQQNC